ncbi:hypothetical protein SMGES_05130 [Serratia marcescens]|nr:hypothetical protein SMGES_05130 [Serratia marcescens]
MTGVRTRSQHRCSFKYDGYNQINALAGVKEMGIIGWIFAGIAVGILVGALIKIFGKKKEQ